MKKQIEWTLGNGKKATYSVELQLTREINLDGDKSIIPCCEINHSLTVENMGFISAEIKSIPARQVGNTTAVAAIGGKVGISQAIYDQIMATIAEMEAIPEWRNKQAVVERNVRDRKAEYAKRIKNGYCPKCGSYCYGDCKAN